MDQSPDDLLTSTEAAAFLGVKKSQLRNYRQRQMIPAQSVPDPRQPSRLLHSFRRDDLARFKEETGLDNSGDWISAEEAGKIAGRHAVSIRQWARKGFLPARLYRGSLEFFSRAEVEALVAGGGPSFEPRKQSPYEFNPTPLECAYLAGFVDGEGHLSIRVRHGQYRSVSGHWSVYFQASNTAPEALHWIAGRFGGKVYGTRHSTGRWKGCYDWKIHCTQALHVLRLIEPFLITRRHQAQLIIQFQEHMAAQTGNRLLTEEEIAWRESMRLQINALNYRGPHPPEET